MSQSPNTMNFLPEDYVEKREAQRSAFLFVGLLLIVVAGIVGAYMYKKWQSEAMFVAHDRVTAQYADAEKKIAQANDIDRQKATMDAKVELATTLMERIPRNMLLRQITELQPPSVHMVSLELTTKEIQPATPTTPMSDIEKAKRQQEGLQAEPAHIPVREVTVELVSIAPTDAEVTKYIAALAKCPMLTDVNLLFSEEFKVGKETATHNIRRFHVEMKLDPKTDLRPTDAVAPN